MRICLSLHVMSEPKHYIFNSKTLSYEVKTRSTRSRVFKTLVMFAVSLGMAVLYFWLYSSVLGFEPPKTALLKKQSAQWEAKAKVLNRQLDDYNDALTTLQMRDDEIYRSLFGMNEIPSEVRNAGFGGVNRYAHYDDIDPDGVLKKTAVRIDVLTKKTYVQSKSFDEVAQLSRRAGEMASCIPAIPPMNPDKSKYRLSSSFGYRRDPFTGRSKRHTGVDFATDISPYLPKSARFRWCYDLRYAGGKSLEQQEQCSDQERHSARCPSCIRTELGMGISLFPLMLSFLG